MKNNWKTLVIIFVVAFAGAMFRNYFEQSKNNNPKTEFIEMKIDSLYSIKVPKYLNKTDKLNGEASYQGMNIEKHAFLIVIDDLNTSRLTLENYGAFVENKFKKGFTETKISNQTKIKVGKFDALQFYLEGSNNNGKTYGFMTVIEGTFDFYQIFSWTALKNNELFFSEIKQTVNSFKEL